MFKAKLIGILCLFLLWGAIIESILHEMNIVYLLKLGVKAAYESGLTFLHGKNFSEMILIDLAENLRCSFVFLFTIFINCVWFLFICQLGLISFHLSTGADIYCIKCYGSNQGQRNHFFSFAFYLLPW